MLYITDACQEEFGAGGQWCAELPGCYLPGLAGEWCAELLAELRLHLATGRLVSAPWLLWNWTSLQQPLHLGNKQTKRVKFRAPNSSGTTTDRPWLRPLSSPPLTPYLCLIFIPKSQPLTCSQSPNFTSSPSLDPLLSVSQFQFSPSNSSIFPSYLHWLLLQ